MYENYTQAINAYDEMLDEAYPNQIMNLSAARILLEVDPIAYRVGFFDWLDGEGIDSDDLDDEGYIHLP